MQATKPKVLYISGSWPPIMCGVGDYLYNLTKNLKTSWSVITSKEAEPGNNVINIVQGWVKPDWSLIERQIKDLNSEIIHYEYPSVMYGRKLFPNMLPKYLKKTFPNKRMLITLHEYHDASLLGKKRIELTLRHFSEVIVTNIEDKKLLQNKFPKKSFEIIRVGSNIEFDKITLDQRKELEKEINPESKKIIMYFGFIDPSKGIENLISSMTELNNDYQLVLATECNMKNKYHSKINDLIAESGADIHWTGYLSNKTVSHLLQISDLLVLPFDSPISARRGSMITAIRHGACVITTGPSEEIFMHQQNCYLMKDNSAGSISEAINYLQSNQKLVFKIKANAIKTSKIFDWAHIAEQHDKIYRN